MRRSAWDELELADDLGALIMVHPGRTSDRESLALSVRETGWFPTTGQAFRAADTADLRWGWIGVTEERTVAICNSQGLAVHTGESLVDIREVTLARITCSERDCLE